MKQPKDFLATEDTGDTEKKISHEVTVKHEGTRRKETVFLDC
jgi:hypothetical protein